MYRQKGDVMNKIISLENLNREKILICKIPWMQEYNGITNGDVPLVFEKDTYSEKKPYTGEIYNFQEFNGKCYGYINGYGNNHIEGYFRHYLQDKTVTHGFKIVWCAFDNNKDLRIVGWYKDAAVYRNHRYLVDFFPQDSDDNGYDCVVAVENSFLVPKEERNFKLNDYLNETQLNYIEENILLYDGNLESDTIDKINIYIDKYKGGFLKSGIMSRLLDEYSEEKLSYEEFLKKGKAYTNLDYMTALKYFNSARIESETSEALFYTAQCLQELNCFQKAVEFYAKSLELDKNNNEILARILICYAKSGDVENTLNISKKVIKLFRSDKNLKRSEWLIDAYFILSNVYVYMNHFDDARNTIKRVLDVKNEAYEKAFVQDVLEIIEDVEEDYFYKM